MSSSEHPIPTVEEERPFDLVEVSSYASAEEGFDHGLVALAVGDAFWLQPASDGFRLLVESQAAERVREQLARYDRESLNWPPRRVAEDSLPRKFDWVTPSLWGALVVASFWAQWEWRAWTEFGLLDARAVLERGDVWRLLTALFLHADVGHLVANAVSGIFVFAAVLATLGRWRGWMSIALAGVVGNLMAAIVNHAGVYRSLGASTAVFGALGLLTGSAIRLVHRGNHPFRWRSLFVPVAAGLTVLGLYGAGDQRVDVVAHVTGFAAGLILGFCGTSRKTTLPV